MIFFRQIFLFHGTKPFRRGTFLCFRMFRVSETFMPERVKKPMSMENLSSHKTEKNSQGNPSVCHQFRVIKKFWMRGRGGGGKEGVSRFSAIFFVSRWRKTS